MKSAFSPAVHSRPTTSLQLRLNHFSTLAGSVNRSALAVGDSGLMSLPVIAWRPGWVGLSVWQVEQDGIFSETPNLRAKNSAPRAALAM